MPTVLKSSDLLFDLSHANAPGWGERCHACYRYSEVAEVGRSGRVARHGKAHELFSGFFVEAHLAASLLSDAIKLVLQVGRSSVLLLTQDELQVSPDYVLL